MGSVSSRRISFAFEKLIKKGRVRKCLLEGQGCSGPVIGAHSIQNAGILELLVEDGHVYTLETSIGRFGPELKLKRTGRGIASTFPGFCSYHDNNLFNEIDFNADRIPIVFTDRQKALFFLRAVSIEGWKKQSVLNSFDSLTVALSRNNFSEVSKILKLPEEIAQDAIKKPQMLESSMRGHLQGLEDMEKTMGSLLWQRRKNKFHSTISYHWIFNFKSNIAVVSGVSPLRDIEGKFLYKKHLPALGEMCHLGLTVFEAQGKVNVLISYLKKDQHILGPLLEQVCILAKDESRMMKWVSEFIAENCENVVFRPKFINSLSSQQKDELEKVFAWGPLYGGPPKKDFSFSFFE